MIQYYFQQINHNRYLKMLYKTPYQISNIDRISMFIRFDTQLNNKFIVLCSFFLFKTTLFKTGHYIVINKKTKQIRKTNYFRVLPNKKIWYSNYIKKYKNNIKNRK